jgi:hypothetical protein
MDHLERDDLEQQLKQALVREEAPPWFEARVMNAVDQAEKEKFAPEQSRRHSGARPRWQWVFATAAVAVAVIGVGGEWQHRVAVERIRMVRLEIEQREAGEAAKAQLRLALRITSTKLAEIQRKIDAERND